MTKEEAIKYLEKADVTVYQEPKTKTAEALEMAIKALREQKPIGRWVNHIKYGYVECSVCGHLTPCNGEDVIENLHYCFWCGTKIGGTENDTMDGVWKCSKCVDFEICSKEAKVLGKIEGCEDFCPPPDEIDFP